MADGFIEIGFGNLARMDEFREMVVIKAADHVHIHAGLKGLTCSSCAIVGDAVIHEFGDRGPVAVHNAAKAPFLAQNFFQRK